MPESGKGISESDYRSSPEELEGYLRNKPDSGNIDKDPVPVVGEVGANDRDKDYTLLLEKFLLNYAKEKSLAISQKKVFFWSIIIFLGILGVAGVVILFLSMFVSESNNIAVVVGACIDIFGAFIAIPTIIAKHLFPEKVDEKVIEIVKVLVDNDKHVRAAIENRWHDYHKQ